MQVVELLLDIESTDVRMIGIQGLGGIGKTTIAKAVYNRIVNHFEASYFLEDVKEKSKKTLLFEILKYRDLEVDNISKGINLIKERLRSKKILLVLDDVDKSEQIENLLGFVIGLP